MKYLALGIPDYGTIPVPSPIQGGSPDFLSNLLTLAISAIVSLGILAALIFLILGGIQWITSGGDKTGVENARKTIIYAIVGLVVIIFSLVIIRIVGTIVGSDLLKNFGPKAYDSTIENRIRERGGP